MSDLVVTGRLGGFTPQELAHWIYRAGAIERELQDLRTQHKELLKWSAEIKGRRAQDAVTAEEIREVNATLTRPERWAKELEPYIETNQYLLEEARYMIEYAKVLNNGGEAINLS